MPGEKRNETRPDTRPRVTPSSSKNNESITAMNGRIDRRMDRRTQGRTSPLVQSRLKRPLRLAVWIFVWLWLVSHQLVPSFPGLGPDGGESRVDANEWMKTKNPRLGKEDRKGELLPFEKMQTTSSTTMITTTTIQSLFSSSISTSFEFSVICVSAPCFSFSHLSRGPRLRLSDLRESNSQLFKKEPNFLAEVQIRLAAFYILLCNFM